jgi:hypothetical protein
MQERSLNPASALRLSYLGHLLVGNEERDFRRQQNRRHGRLYHEVRAINLASRIQGCVV